MQPTRSEAEDFLRDCISPYDETPTGTPLYLHKNVVDAMYWYAQFCLGKYQNSNEARLRQEIKRLEDQVAYLMQP